MLSMFFDASKNGLSGPPGTPLGKIFNIKYFFGGQHGPKMRPGSEPNFDHFSIIVRSNFQEAFKKPQEAPRDDFGRLLGDFSSIFIVFKMIC